MPNHHTRLVVGSLAAFLLLAMLHTWPLASAPAHWSRVDSGDGALNVWAIGWVGRALTSHPTELFNGNIFYPEKLTLAYSEAMLIQGAIGAPVIAMGGSAVLAYNVALVAGLTLTGWAFCLLVQRWTGSWSAGMVAGSLAAFNAHTLGRLGHLQYFHTEFFPLILFALDRLIATRALRHVWWLAIGFALQSLTSFYMLVFSAWMLMFAALSRLREWWKAGALGMIARFSAAAAIAVVLLLPYLLEYKTVHDQMGFSRTADEQEAGSWMNYLSTASRLHFNRWSYVFGERATSFNFPGFAAVALLIVAFSDRANTSDPRFRMAVAAAAGCAAISLAPHLPFYGIIHSTIPLFQAVRQLAHIGHVVLMMIAIVAGFGVAALQREWRHSQSWPAAVIAILIAVNGEALRAPIGYTWFDGIPPIYDVLAKEPNAVVVETPFPMPQQWFLNGKYMVNSTRHWRPLLNGYSGFRPASYYDSYEIMRAFPSDRSLIALFERGVTHIVIHKKDYAEGFSEARMKELSSVNSLQYVAQDDDILIYRLLRP